jgi:fatty-acyl-CoA synthase
VGAFTAADFTFEPLTPIAFLRRSADVFADRLAIVDGDQRFTYRQFGDRCRRLTGVLTKLGIGPGDRVAALCANSHVMAEVLHGVPAAGAVAVPLNVRLSLDELVYIVDHAGAALLLATAEFAEMATAVATRLGLPCLVASGLADDPYEAALVAAQPRDPVPIDERDLLALNYTSGTTGRPKGVMYHHRGAYLQSLAMALHSRLTLDSAYLWTLPMFHCNGWCFTWATVAAGATQVCLRTIDPAEIWPLLRNERITHFSAAPTVLTMIAYAPEAAGAPLPRPVHVDTGGAPPSPTLLAALSKLRMDVTHLYGLTETFGPIIINEWWPEWGAEPAQAQARLKARQGVANVVSAPARVVDGDGCDVPRDGRTIGEVVVRGNNTMLGYYRDPASTRAATLDGQFRTGDLAVMHEDGYLELKDRSKDIIISGGENIASVEVESAIAEHPAVLECAVVARPDPLWGEVPVAFVTLRSGQAVTGDELRTHVRERLAHFKTPRAFVFAELPKTATGKVRKHDLREIAAESDGGQTP